MPTTLKLLSKLKDEELETVYEQFLRVTLEDGRRTVPWSVYVQHIGREKALTTLMLSVNRQHPADSRLLWLMSILIVSILYLTSTYI